MRAAASSATERSAQPKIDAVQRPAATSFALHGPPTATIGGNAVP